MSQDVNNLSHTRDHPYKAPAPPPAASPPPSPSPSSSLTPTIRGTDASSPISDSGDAHATPLPHPHHTFASAMSSNPNGNGNGNGADPAASGTGTGSGTGSSQQPQLQPPTRAQPHDEGYFDRDGRPTQRQLGMGRPRIPSTNRTYSPNMSPARTLSIRSYSTEDEDEDDATATGGGTTRSYGTAYSPRALRTSIPDLGHNYGDTTPRSSSRRPPIPHSQSQNPPQTAVAGSFSPHTTLHGLPPGAGGSAPRPARARFSTSATVFNGGTTPRSASTSRSRPPLVTALSGRKDKDRSHDDDESMPRDRGEDLIRRRQAERRAKREREKEQRRLEAEGGQQQGGYGMTSGPGETDVESTAPPTAYTDDPSQSSMQQQQRAGPQSLGVAGSRSVSRSRAPSAGGAPRGASMERRIPSGIQVPRAGSLSLLDVDAGALASASSGAAPAPHAAVTAPNTPWSEMPNPLGGAGAGRAESVLSAEDEDVIAGLASRAPSVIGEVVQEALDAEREEIERQKEEEEAGMEGEEGEEVEGPGEGDGEDEDEEHDVDETEGSTQDDEGVTVRDRQDAINIEHPFGLPIWKPALYRKSRSVTRNAESALHSIPSAAAERHLLPGNIMWVVFFGWWLAITCAAVAILVTAVEVVLAGGARRGGEAARAGYGRTLRELAWYIGWPFGKYVEGEGPPDARRRGHGHGLGHGSGGYGSMADGTEDGDVEGAEGEGEREGEQVGTDGAREWGHPHETREVSDGGASNVTIRERPRKDSGFGQLPDEPSPFPSPSIVRPSHPDRHGHNVSFAPDPTIKGKARHSDEEDGDDGDATPTETTSLLNPNSASAGGEAGSGSGFRRQPSRRTRMLGGLVYWPAFYLVVAPIMLFVCVLCWGFVFTIPMAKLTWALIKLLASRPLEIKFRSAPKINVPSPEMKPVDRDGESGDGEGGDSAASRGESVSGSGSETLNGGSQTSPSYMLKRARLHAGQIAPTSGPTSTVLLCTYRAVGLQYYKYTIGGVNILFINLVPLVFFVIIDGLILLPAVERAVHRGEHVSPFMEAVTSQALIFVLSLASVIPLSYFIGMAVASISAQSSIGMGAVINATFGSVIEVILYGIALTQGKGRLVEGSIIGSILAGVLLMPGTSMCSGALKRKEQKFNAKSAGVTSTMLIMAIIGTLTPTMFYQTYGTFQLHCDGCPEGTFPGGNTSNPGSMINAREAWMCERCFYEHPEPATDPFYQDQVKNLMYACAGILLFSYLIGLWFSLRTHASQIWQNPQQLMAREEAAAAAAAAAHGVIHPAVQKTLTQRLTPNNLMQHVLPSHRVGSGSVDAGHGQAHGAGAGVFSSRPASPLAQRFARASVDGESHVGTLREHSNQAQSGGQLLPQGYTPLLESVDRDLKSQAAGGVPSMRLPTTLTTEDFTRAVAAATVTALRHQRSIIGAAAAGGGGGGHGHGPAVASGASGAGGGSLGVAGGSTMTPFPSVPPTAVVKKMEEKEEDHAGGGHEAPSWTRGVSAGVLLFCTLLYAIIAEILVDVVDVVLKGSGVDEKFLGLTLFALVPNTTEFMNAMSFAMNGNIALSMEIGSAYALQVCLLQIPAMVAFSAFYDPAKLGDAVDTFTLIFPRWDVIAIILSIFLLTYTYIEARSNYHRGSILVLAYIVLMMGFYYAPTRTATSDPAYFVQPSHAEMVGADRAGWSKFWA